jgi:hypothetical protein
MARDFSHAEPSCRLYVQEAHLPIVRHHPHGHGDFPMNFLRSYRTYSAILSLVSLISAVAAGSAGYKWN